MFLSCSPRQEGRLAAGVGVAAFGQAAVAWLEDGTVGFGAQMARTFAALRSLLVGSF